ncbi:MAG: hypothetical protein ACYTED_20500 [Planctomycetota bacterium]|jgi:hypothetical protein
MDAATLAFAAKVLISALEALRHAGWEPTVADLNQIREMSQRAVDEWNALVEKNATDRGAGSSSA